MKKSVLLMFMLVMFTLTACGKQPEEQFTYQNVTKELEGTEYTTSVSWNLAGKEGVLDVSDQILSFHDILNGDFDRDGADEVVLVFDLHSVGGNSGYGLYMFKWQSDKWVNVSGAEPFTGFDKECLPFDELTVTEESDGTYLVMKQYCPGEFKMDHIGDVITTFFSEGNKLTVKESKFVAVEEKL